MDLGQRGLLRLGDGLLGFGVVVPRVDHHVYRLFPTATRG